MKTVIDAVNEFQAEFSSVPCGSREARFIFESVCSNNSWPKGYLVADDENYSPGLLRLVCTKHEFYQCVKEMMEMKITPVYTQEMADNDELPSVGMSCLYKLHHKDDVYFDDCFIVGVSKDGEWLVFHDHENNLHNHHIAEGVYIFKPIDNLADSERAFNEFINTEFKVTKREYINFNKEQLGRIKVAFAAGVEFGRSE